MSSSISCSPSQFWTQYCESRRMLPVLVSPMVCGWTAAAWQETAHLMHVISLGLLKQWCLSTSRPVESVAGGSILSFFVFSGTHFSISLKHPASITVGLHAHLLRVPGQAGKSKDLGSKEEEARDLTVAFTGFRCDTSHLLSLSSGIELGCQLPV